jgi:hypothetical protein
MSASARRLREQGDELQCRVEHNRGRLAAIDDDIERRRDAAGPDPGGDLREPQTQAEGSACQQAVGPRGTSAPLSRDCRGRTLRHRHEQL